MKRYQPLRSISSPSVNKRKKGFTLTEIAIVLGIVGLILGAVWSAAKNVYSNVNNTKAAEIASILIAQVRGAYANNPPAGANGSPDLSPAFQSVAFSVDKGCAPGGNACTNGAGTDTSIPALVGAYDASHFAIYMNGTTHSLGTDNLGLAACSGIVQTASALGGDAINAITTTIPTGACGVVADCGGAPAGYTRACVGGNGVAGSNTGTCTYSDPNICNATQKGVMAVVIPYQPS